MGVKSNLGSQDVGIAGCGFRPQVCTEECFEERRSAHAQRMRTMFMVSTPVGPGEGPIAEETLPSSAS